MAMAEVAIRVCVGQQQADLVCLDKLATKLHPRHSALPCAFIGCTLCAAAELRVHVLGKEHQRLYLQCSAVQ